MGVWQNDRVEIIANDQGNRTTPSYVAFTDTERLIGDAAKNQTAMNPRNTIFDAKRMIGRKISDPSIQQDMKTWPFKVVPGPDQKPMVEGALLPETSLCLSSNLAKIVFLFCASKGTLCIAKLLFETSAVNFRSRPHKPAPISRFFSGKEGVSSQQKSLVSGDFLMRL